MNQVRGLKVSALHLLVVLLGASVWVQAAQPQTAASVVTEAGRLRSADALPQAEALLLQFLSQHPDDPGVLTALASLRVEEGKTDEATGLLTHALRADPGSRVANQALGDLFLSGRHYPEAMDRFETVLGVAKEDKAARDGERRAAVELALEARRQGRQDAALASLAHAAHYLPDDPVLLTDLGIQAQALHQTDTAQHALEQALRVAPRDPAALYALARVEVDEQHLPAGEAHLRDYLAVRPEDASAHYGLGRLLHMELRTEEAKVELQRSIALQPEQTESYSELGQIALDAHDDEAARALFKRVVTRDPKHGGALSGLGILAYRARDYVAAEGYLAAAVASSPEYQPAHYYYGLTLARLGKSEASSAELKRAAELASNLHAKPVAATQQGP